METTQGMGTENPASGAQDSGTARLVAETVALASEAREASPRRPRGRPRKNPDPEFSSAPGMGSHGPGPGARPGRIEGESLDVDDETDAPFVWDPDGTRAGILGLVSTFEGGAKLGVRLATADVVGSERAENFADAMAIAPEVREPLVEGCVALCQKHGVNVGPEWGILGCLTQIGGQWAGVVKEIRALRAEWERQGKPAPNATRP